MERICSIMNPLGTKIYVLPKICRKCLCNIDQTARLCILLSIITLLNTCDVMASFPVVAGYFSFESKLTTRYEIECSDDTCRATFLIRIAVYFCILTGMHQVTQMELTMKKLSIYSTYSEIMVNVLNYVCFSKLKIYNLQQPNMNWLLLLLSGDIEVNPGPETDSELDSIVAVLPMSPKRESTCGRPSMMEVITFENITEGDHILYQVTQTPYRETYRSALVTTQDPEDLSQGKIKIMTNIYEYGVIETKVQANDLPDVKLVVYTRCKYKSEDAIHRAKKRMKENYHHPLRNNSHQFVSWCKTGKEYDLKDILSNLEYTENSEQCKEHLKTIMFKKCARSTDDLQCGQHLMLNSKHYLVQSVNSEEKTFSAYTICDNRVHLCEPVWPSEEKLYIIDCTKHRGQSNPDKALEQAKGELEKNTRLWNDSYCFVTAMLCGEQHSVELQYLLTFKAAPTTCNLVTPDVQLTAGAHLLIKNLSNEFRSVIVLEYKSDGCVKINPPLSDSDDETTIDLTNYPEVYLIGYDNCLPNKEAVKRASSLTGKKVLETHSHDHTIFSTWVKTGQESSFKDNLNTLLEDIPPSQRRRCEFLEVKSTQEITVGDHLIERCHRRLRHLLVTDNTPANFKVIFCRHNQVCEESYTFDFSHGQLVFKIKYTDNLPVSETSNLIVKRAKSYLGKQIYHQWSHVLFVVWAKTGAKEHFDIDVYRQPVSKKRIKSFTQVIPGDYVFAQPVYGWNHHFLIESIHSPSQCFAFEYYNNKIVTRCDLTLPEPGKFPLYYRIDYEPGACLPNNEIVQKAKDLLGKTQPKGINYQNFVHYLKTQQKLEVSIKCLQISCDFQSETFPLKSYLGSPQFVRAVSSPNELVPGDHIIYRIDKPPSAQQYQSALVVELFDNQTMELITMTCIHGIVSLKYNYDLLPSLHQVVYNSCQYSEHDVILRAKKFLADQEHSHYDEIHNNSHTFVVLCKTEKDYPIGELVNELIINEQGRSSQLDKSLQPVLTKVPLKSINDIKRGDHIVIESHHYLVNSVECALDKISVFKVTIHKYIDSDEKRNIKHLITKKKIFLIDYDPHCTLVDTDTMFRRIQIEMKQRRTWQHSDEFVTAMKCGIGHLVDDRCYMSHDDKVIVGCTEISSSLNNSVDIGDHLLIKKSGSWHSVLVCRFIKQSTVATIPAINHSDSQHQMEETDLNSHSPIYRVNYKQCLSPTEVVERAQNLAGKTILERSENKMEFVTWAKTGRVINVDVDDIINVKQIEVSHPIRYRKVLTSDELQVGQHVFKRGRLHLYCEHYLITEKNIDSNQTTFKAIWCFNALVSENEIELDPEKINSDLYQVIYQDELPPEIAIKRARSHLGKIRLSPTARMWFVPWAKTGSKDGIEVDLIPNLTRPVSKSRISCFTQLNEGDYLVEENSHYCGWYHHYLVLSVKSPDQCTVIEAWKTFGITQKTLHLLNSSNSDNYPWFYRINYEDEVCILPEVSVEKANDLLRERNWIGLHEFKLQRRSLIHYLKTGETAYINVGNLLDDRILLQRERITSAMELKCGDHIERPLSFASSYAQHHMMVVQPVDQKHCRVIHYKVSPSMKVKKGKVVEETVNIFDQRVCFRVCYPERVDPDIGMAKLRDSCGEDKYNLFGNNCEHLVMVATLGAPLSIQVDKFIYNALQTTSKAVKSVRVSCLHHGMHLTPESSIHGACHAGSHGIKHGIKQGIKATNLGSLLGPTAGIAFAFNLLIDGSLCVRGIYKLRRKHTFGAISTREYQRSRDTKVITTINSIIGGTLGAVVGQAVIWQVPIAGAAVGGIVGNVAGHTFGNMEAKLHCSIWYPNERDITLPPVTEKDFIDITELDC